MLPSHIVSGPPGGGGGGGDFLRVELLIPDLGVRVA